MPLNSLRRWIQLQVWLVMMALAPGASAQQGDRYQRHIQPILDRYCVVCHSCLDAPCQLDLGSAAGLLRGASKRPAYDGKRLRAASPTRLGIDAQSESAWRTLDFHSVLDGANGSPAPLARLLALKQANPPTHNEPLPAGLDIRIRRRNFCPSPAESEGFASKHPRLGMPFALPPIPPAEDARLREWIERGAPVEPPAIRLSASEKRQIARWEAWLNDPEPRRALVARWLFEHWAIALLHFDGARSGRFLRLVRSATPSGEPVRELATRRPNSDPGGAFHYRFVPQVGARTYKTHIVFGLDDALLADIETRFLGGSWQLERLPGYSTEERSNPFRTFAAIPARARYGFMLEHAGYFVRTFIRGPVCRGQLATDVIRDHFWVMFQHPEHDPYISDAGYRRTVDPLLDLPGLEYDLLDGAKQWFAAAKERNQYVDLRQRAMARRADRSASLTAIWDGGGENPNALLTVFRHHDSAAVRRGWIGQRPLTLWWMDFPLFERSYYNLVVNFDVFGSIAHQAQTRLYFDLIRNGAEQNFLRLLPGSARAGILGRWYQGLGKLKLWVGYEKIDRSGDGALDFSSDDPQTELLTALLKRFSAINAGRDPVLRPDGSDRDETRAALATLVSRPASVMPAIRHMPDAAILRVTDDRGSRKIYTLVRNRRHSNVAFILGESLRYQPQHDELAVLDGVATSYPNYIFSVPAREIAQFVAALGASGAGEQRRFKERVVDRWGLARSATDFWQVFHDINRYLVEEDPVEAGLLDLNRYVDYRPRAEK